MILVKSFHKPILPLTSFFELSYSMRMKKTRWNVYVDAGVKTQFSAICRGFGKQPSWLLECFMRYVTEQEHLSDFGKAVMNGMVKARSDLTPGKK